MFEIYKCIKATVLFLLLLSISWHCYCEKNEGFVVTTFLCAHNMRILPFSHCLYNKLYCLDSFLLCIGNCICLDSFLPCIGNWLSVYRHVSVGLAAQRPVLLCKTLCMNRLTPLNDISVPMRRLHISMDCKIEIFSIDPIIFRSHLKYGTYMFFIALKLPLQLETKCVFESLCQLWSPLY